MSDLIASALSNPIIAAIVIIALGILATIVILGFIQGREISLGPIKIGPRPEKPGNREESKPVLNQTSEIFKNSPENTLAKELGQKEGDIPAPNQVPDSNQHSESSQPLDLNQDQKIYNNSDNHEFSKLFEDRLKEAKRIVMIGTGFNIMRREDFRLLLAQRLREKCHVEIYAANPFSPNVETRLIEEETGDVNPKIRKGGLIDWLSEMLSIKAQLKDKSNFIFRLFPFYPAYALFIFDDQDYFYYPYGFVQLGTLSPVMHYSVKNEAHQIMIQFLNSQYKLINERSSEADLVYSLYKDNDQNNNQKPEPSQLVPFAIYIVPSKEEDFLLYNWGSKVLEYDVRGEKILPMTKWHKFIGAASNFGLHITVADALYCSSEADLDLISKEVRSLAQEFRSFTVGLSLEKDFPNEYGIALVCHDETGSLEALHSEMVMRVYRKAVASNYSLGLAKADRDPDQRRAELMIERYHAPYIFQRFKPHISLLSNVPAEKKDQIYQDLSDSLGRNGVRLSMEVRTITIMDGPQKNLQPPLDTHWRIRRSQADEKPIEYKFKRG